MNIWTLMQTMKRLEYLIEAEQVRPLTEKERAEKNELTLIDVMAVSPELAYGTDARHERMTWQSETDSTDPRKL